MAANNESGRMLELFQIQSSEGPCVDCVVTREPVVNADLAHAADRWPQFAPRALAAGFRSVHAFPMRLRDQAIGALNLFGSLDARFAPEEVRWCRRWPTWPRSPSCRHAASPAPRRWRSSSRGAQQPHRDRAGQGCARPRKRDLDVRGVRPVALRGTDQPSSSMSPKRSSPASSTGPESPLQAWVIQSPTWMNRRLRTSDDQAEPVTGDRARVAIGSGEAAHGPPTRASRRGPGRG